MPVRSLWIMATGLLLVATAMFFALRADGGEDPTPGALAAFGATEVQPCDPRGPVHVSVEVVADGFRIRTETTTPVRGEVRVSLELADGASLEGGSSSWTGVGERHVRVVGDSTGAFGEVVARAVLPNGEICTARESLAGIGTRNAVAQARPAGEGILEIPGVSRETGGAR